MPAGLISKDKMIDVLTAVSLAEASAYSGALPPAVFAQSMATKYENIMQQHNITYQQFNDTFAYYTNHPDSLAAIMQEVENRLSMMSSKSQAHSANKTPVDSTKNSPHEP